MKVIYFVMLLLAGCAASKELVLPDGKVGYNIACDGIFSGYGECMTKAGDLCPAGYDVLSINGSSTKDNVVVDGLSPYTSPTQAVSGEQTNRNIVAKCR